MAFRAGSAHRRLPGPFVAPAPLLPLPPVLALALAWIAGSRCAAQDVPPETVSRQEHDALLEEVAKMRRELDELKRQGPGAPPGAPSGTAAGDAGEASSPSTEGPSRLGGYRGGVYDKPVLTEVGRRVAIGGYFDVEFRDPENQRHDFRFHRLVPLIYADLHERLRFASEIEIEDGSEVEVEFATLDFLLVEPANFRGGVILDPLGKFNLIHDSPINDLTDRPLVDDFVIPTTLREIGAGLFGTLTPRDSAWEVKYEAYLTSGFKGLDDDGTTTITREDGLRESRAHEEVLDTRHFGDNNNSFAGVGRLSVSPLLGTEIGASAHHGAYDESGNNDLTIAAVDALFTVPEFRLFEAPVGPIELLGEAAYAFIERNGFARASGVPDDFWGYYGQVNYHFMPDFLRQHLPLVFLPGSVFTLVGRWDQIDLDGSRRRRATVGINFRPIESTVIKFDYQFNRATGDAPREDEDDAFLISLASYF